MNSSSLRISLALAATVFALASADPAPAASFTITVNDNNACTGTWQTTGPANNPTITCVTGTPAPSGGPTCTITPSQTVSPNTSVVLALSNCTAPSGGTITYSWNQGSVGGTQVGTGATFTTPLLTTTTTYFATATANGLSTTYSTTVTVTTPLPAGNCANYTAVSLGDLQFDGTRNVSSGMKGSAVAYGRIVIPNPLPANWVGKTAQISVFEYGDGAFWKKVYLSKTPCDFGATAAASGQGTGVNIYVTFGSAGYGSVAVQPGDVWFINIKNESIFGTPSCGAGLSCNFAISAYPPS